MWESGKTEMGDNSLVSQKLAIRELARNLIIKKIHKTQKNKPHSFKYFMDTSGLLLVTCN